jgi:AraC family transcriptional regulator of arabinose operon
MPDYARIVQTTFPESLLHLYQQRPENRSIVVTRSGCFERASGHIANRKRVTEHVVIYCVKGTGWIFIAGNRIAIAAGDLIVLPLELPHSYGADSEDPWTIYWFHAIGERVAYLAEAMRLTRSLPKASIGLNSHLMILFEDLAGLSSEGISVESVGLASAAGEHILRMGAVLLGKIGAPASNIHLQALAQHLADHYEERLSLNEMARRCFMSRYYFCRAFKTLFGVSPVEYHNTVRMKEAARRVLDTTERLVDIALAVGFSDYAYFSKRFSLFAGMSPTRYRASAR